MNTPIVDFVTAYAASGTKRMHMPGHKGRGPLGCERLDITEIRGADALYEAEGIIEESQRNAASLFGSAFTHYSVEGSSQCIRAMLYLAVTHRARGTAPVIVAARNAHKAFLYAAALIGFEPKWLYPEENSESLCSCPVSPKQLEHVLTELKEPPAAVYVTSPDYLGGMLDIRALAEVCHRHNTLLLTDNAHGAHLHFLDTPIHPLDLGADLCCDSAHKTLPVLTGGAYLHISRSAPAIPQQDIRRAMVLFGSTSPSYLIMQSLDSCNIWLANEARDSFRACIRQIDAIKETLRSAGWRVLPGDPMKIVLQTDGFTAADRLREHGIECEYADADHIVLMLSPFSETASIEELPSVLGAPPLLPARSPLPAVRPQQACPVREAFFLPHETIPVQQSAGRICAAPTVACPPAIPIAAAGELLNEQTTALFLHYGISEVEVLKENY